MLPIPTMTVVPEIDLEVVILSIRSKVGTVLELDDRAKKSTIAALGKTRRRC